MFLIYINDLGNCFQSSKFLLFADDMNIFMPMTSINDVRALQCDIDKFTEWCNKNKMSLNTSKCVKILFNRSRSDI